MAVENAFLALGEGARPDTLGNRLPSSAGGVRSTRVGNVLTCRAQPAGVERSVFERDYVRREDHMYSAIFKGVWCVCGGNTGRAPVLIAN